jgi:predicted PurR-regulated permease PerM
MRELYEKHKLFFVILVVAIIGFLVWYFSQIVIFIIVAMVISIIGTPLVEKLDTIKIGRFNFPHTLSVTLTILLMVIVFFGLFAIFIPLVISEAQMISVIDGNKLAEYFKHEILWVEEQLFQLGIMPKESSVATSFKDMVLKVLDFGMFSNLLSAIISFTGNFFFNVGSILFLSFFFLHDSSMMPRLIILLFPEKYVNQIKRVMLKSRVLLSRYFIGLIIEVLINIALYSLGLFIVGVKGALVIGFLAGILVVIPYLGGLIAIIIGVLLGVTGVISAGEYAMILPMAIKVVIAMLLVQVLDNNIFQPFIQGKSVKAHPVEIFLVVIAAASFGGIPGIIVAVPAYGFLKIVAVEFLSQFKVIQKMSDNM